MCAASALVGSLGVPLDRHGKVAVTPTLRAPGLRNVFVIGDLAALEQAGKPVPGVAPAAMQEGRFAARAIVAELAGKPVSPFHYWDKGELATIGRFRAVGALPHGVKLSGFVAQTIVPGRPPLLFVSPGQPPHGVRHLGMVVPDVRAWSATHPAALAGAARTFAPARARPSVGDRGREPHDGVAPALIAGSREVSSKHAAARPQWG